MGLRSTHLRHKDSHRDTKEATVVRQGQRVVARLSQESSMAEKDRKRQ